MISRVARFCARHRWRVVLAWLALVVGLSAVGSAVADEYRMDFSLPGSEAQNASDLLQRIIPRVSIEAAGTAQPTELTHETA